VGDTPGYLRPYEDAVRAHGADAFESLLWRSEKAQRRRFDALASMTRLDGRVLCDIGCGRADLAAYLAEHAHPWRGYIGVEGVPALARACRERAAGAGWAGVEIVEADFVADEALPARLVAERRVEVFVVSGSLNTLDQPAALAVVERLWRAVAPVPHGAVVFNFLGDRFERPHGDDTGPAHRYDTLAVLAWALERTPIVRFRQDYLAGHDATILMGSPARHA
jgi:precorrin-6B methylase 2